MTPSPRQAATSPASAPPSAPKLGRAEGAYELLKAEIMGNRMPPGFQEPEPEIARRLGMSRTPVREALIRLRGEGLLELIPRRGPRVLPVDPGDMREIYQLLVALEPEAAADAAKSGLPPARAAVLKSATDGMARALKAGDLERWAAADDMFHRELLQCCGNRRLTAFVGGLLDQSHRARMITLRLRKTPWESTRDHRAILKSILEGDVRRARKLFRAHRERAAAELLDILEKLRLSRL